jgi:molybdate transport system substrate-binding protein
MRALLAIVLACGLVAGCGSADDADSTITVFAATSLTDAFTELGAAFEDANANATVQFNFAASSALATQINEGAPADVFASADTNQMSVVVDAGNAERPRLFATNLPVVVVSADSALETFEDLATEGLRLVLAGPDVPVGRYSRQILENASGPGGISADFAERALANLRSDEANVRAVLSKVQLGEADAGIVYQTDARVAGDDVKVIEIPAEFNVVAEYPIVAVNDSDEADVAAAFIAFVLSPDGQAILREYGFSTP